MKCRLPKKLLNYLYPSITFNLLGKYGQLGNQLFQMATVIALAQRFNVPYQFPSWEWEPFFPIKGCFRKKVKFSHTYKEPSYHFSPVPFQQGLNLVGYFQSERYFNDAQATIKRLLTPTNVTSCFDNTTAIHVRRGDYFKYPNVFKIQTMDYYEKAMETIPSKRYLVFSNDIPWCKDHFRGNCFEFAEGNLPITDLGLMARCDRHIIGNSSFSWWAAWLSPYSKKVIAPKYWFCLEVHEDTRDLIPSSWLEI